MGREIPPATLPVSVCFSSYMKPCRQRYGWRYEKCRDGECMLRGARKGYCWLIESTLVDPLPAAGRRRCIPACILKPFIREQGGCVRPQGSRSWWHIWMSTNFISRKVFFLSDLQQITRLGFSPGHVWHNALQVRWPSVSALTAAAPYWTGMVGLVQRRKVSDLILHPATVS